MDRASRDQYRNFAELAQHESEGRDFRRRLDQRRSPLAIIAPHGGGIEPGTSEIAAAVAGDVFSLYCFEGLRPARNAALHLTSIRFDDPICVELLLHSSTAITVHGCQGSGEELQVGGLDEQLALRVARGLAAAGFAIKDGRGNSAGRDRRNLCNRGTSGRGVQLELSAALRRSLFAGLSRSARQTKTPAFERLVSAIRRELFAALAERTA